MKESAFSICNKHNVMFEITVVQPCDLFRSSFRNKLIIIQLGIPSGFLFALFVVSG